MAQFEKCIPPQRLKAGTEKKRLIAAVHGCATRKQGKVEFFSKL